MFKFFKEMLQAAKEGAAEGLEEVKAETAEKQSQLDKAAHIENEPLLAMFAEASRFERFAVALGAVYRQAFMTELVEADLARRPAVYLMCFAVSPEKRTSMAKLLARDFSVENASDAQTMVAALVEDLLTLDDADQIAVWAARASYVASTAVALDYMDAKDALSWLEPVVEKVVATHASWASFSAGFLLGERHAPGSSLLGRQMLVFVSASLLKDDRSPWVILDWPSPDDVPGLLATRGAGGRKMVADPSA